MLTCEHCMALGASLMLGGLLLGLVAAGGIAWWLREKWQAAPSLSGSVDELLRRKR